MRLLSKLLKPVNTKRELTKLRNEVPHQSSREAKRRLRQIARGATRQQNGATESAMSAALRDVA